MRALAALMAQSGEPGSCSESWRGMGVRRRRWGGGWGGWMLRWMRIEKDSCLILTDGSSRVMEPGQLANRMLLLALCLPTPLQLGQVHCGFTGSLARGLHHSFG